MACNSAIPKRVGSQRRLFCSSGPGRPCHMSLCGIFAFLMARSSCPTSERYSCSLVLDNKNKRSEERTTRSPTTPVNVSSSVGYQRNDCPVGSVLERVNSLSGVPSDCQGTSCKTILGSNRCERTGTARANTREAIQVRRDCFRGSSGACINMRIRAAYRRLESPSAMVGACRKSKTACCEMYGWMV